MNNRKKVKRIVENVSRFMAVPFSSSHYVEYMYW